MEAVLFCAMLEVTRQLRVSAKVGVVGRKRRRSSALSSVVYVAARWASAELIVCHAHHHEALHHASYGNSRYERFGVTLRLTISRLPNADAVGMKRFNR